MPHKEHCNLQILTRCTRSSEGPTNSGATELSLNWTESSEWAPYVYIKVFTLSGLGCCLLCFPRWTFCAWWQNNCYLIPAKFRHCLVFDGLPVVDHRKLKTKWIGNHHRPDEDNDDDVKMMMCVLVMMLLVMLMMCATVTDLLAPPSSGETTMHWEKIHFE